MSVFNWRCPLCSSPLEMKDNRWSCINNHVFDRAKEGYVNLLLAQNKNSKAPGDSKEMIAARRLFLRGGHYQPLVKRIAELLKQHLHQTSASLFDAGCGEGYYLESVVELMQPEVQINNVTGIDISKWAVQKAAKSAKSHHYAVASTFDIPIYSSAYQACIQVFAPASNDELHRILDDQGILIQVSPAPKHLYELKQFVYDRVDEHAVDETVPDGFMIVEDTLLQFDVELDSPESRHALLMMTPFYWQTPEEKKDAILTSLQKVGAHFHIRVLRKQKRDD